MPRAGSRPTKARVANAHPGVPGRPALAGVVSHPPGHALLAAAVRKERGEGASEGRTDA